MYVVRPKQIYLEPEKTVEMNETVVYAWATVCLANGKFPAGLCDPGVPKLAEGITNESGRAHETEPKSLKKAGKKVK